MSTYVALLRGINVGGKNRLAMRDLVAMLEASACVDVRTYIQSGNVVFKAPTRVADGLAARLEQRIARDTGLKVPVVLRSAAELAQVPRKNPFLAAGADPEHLYVSFLADVPAARAAAALDPERSPGDAYRLIGRDIYMHLPHGAGQSKLTNAYFDSKLATISTGRNWRTVLKLIEMVQA